VRTQALPLSSTTVRFVVCVSGPSSASSSASSSAGDHLRLGNGKAFRIVVLNVRGRPVVFEIDADSPTLDSSFLAEVKNLLASLRFPKG
jgi:hypothetical protein